MIGAGSIGSRHARNLLAHGAAVTVMDPQAERSAAIEGARPVPFDLDALGGFDGVVVASPTVHHRRQTEAALQAGDARILVEKPIDLSTDGMEGLLKAGRDRLMVGYNLRLHAPVEQLVEMVLAGRCGEQRSARLWFGSYLPDWRPGVDYRATYSAHTSMGGGILFDAIHELDLALWLMGGPLDVVCSTVARVGDLDIDVEDTVKALLRRPRDGCPVEVSLDYLSRRYRRGIEVVGSEATVRLDWARQVIEIERASGVQVRSAATDVATSYVREAAAFLDFIREGSPPPVNGESGAASVRLAVAIREAAG